MLQSCGEIELIGGCAIVETTGEGWELPGETKAWSDWTWFHIKPGKARIVVVLSEKPLWYQGHFVHGRMAPCVGSECIECARGTGAQIRWVFACAEVETRRQGLMEVGQATQLELRQYVTRAGRFRGLVLCFGRYSKAKQSRIECEYVDDPMPVWAHEMAATDLGAALRATWTKAGFSVPGTAASQTGNRLRSEDFRSSPPPLREAVSSTRKAG